MFITSTLVALFSGITATILFFKDTDLSKNCPSRLAIIEVTQATEIVFTIIGGNNLPLIIEIICVNKHCSSSRN